DGVDAPGAGTTGGVGVAGGGGPARLVSTLDGSAPPVVRPSVATPGLPRPTSTRSALWCPSKDDASGGDELEPGCGTAPGPPPAEGAPMLGVAPAPGPPPPAAPAPPAPGPPAPAPAASGPPAP